jgi:3-oxoacyl-[acyl-carrier-protein] synthase-3
LIQTRIRALASELPTEVVSDASRAEALGIGEDVVRRLCGGRARYEAPAGEGSGELARRAVVRMLDDVGLAPTDIDFIVFATNSSDWSFPGTACSLQAMLDLATIGCLDIRAQCTGFVVGLDTARRFVAGGMYNRVLVAAADVYSHLVRTDGVEQAELACLVGDGGAVALVEKGDGPGRILSCRYGVDGSRYEEFWCELPASRHFQGEQLFGDRDRLPPAAVEEGRHFPRIDRVAMRETALAHVPEVFAAALSDAGLSRVDLTIVAHLDPLVEKELAERLGSHSGRVETSELLYSGGGATAVALDRLCRAGKANAGETVALVTSGAGASWGAVILEVPS